MIICLTNEVGNLGTTIKTFTLVNHSSYENVSFEYLIPPHFEYFVPRLNVHFTINPFPVSTIYLQDPGIELYDHTHGSWSTDTITEIIYDPSFGPDRFYPFSESNFWGRRFFNTQWISIGNIGTINLAQWESYLQDVKDGNKRNLSGSPK